MKVGNSLIRKCTLSGLVVGEQAGDGLVDMDIERNEIDVGDHVGKVGSHEFIAVGELEGRGGCRWIGPR